MNWREIKKEHIITDPTTVIKSNYLFDLKQYDILYENQNNLQHRVWQEFKNKYKVGFEFKENLESIDLTKEVIALWFFRERSDRTAAPDLNVGGVIVGYYPNGFMLTKCNDIKIDYKKKKYIRYPFLQIDMTAQQFDDIIKYVNDRK